MNKRARNIEILHKVKQGRISRQDARYLFAMDGIFKPNFNRQDKPYKAVCTLFDEHPDLMELFTVDLSELTDSELRTIINLQENERPGI